MKNWTLLMSVFTLFLALSIVSQGRIKDYSTLEGRMSGLERENSQKLALLDMKLNQVMPSALKDKNAPVSQSKIHPNPRHN